MDSSLAAQIYFDMDCLASDVIYIQMDFGVWVHDINCKLHLSGLVLGLENC